MAIAPRRQSENVSGVVQKNELKVTSREQMVRDLLSKSWGGNAPIIASPGDIDAVGHRVVHGGPHFEDPVVITPEVSRQSPAFLHLRHCTLTRNWRVQE